MFYKLISLPSLVSLTFEELLNGNNFYDFLKLDDFPNRESDIKRNELSLTSLKLYVVSAIFLIELFRSDIITDE